MAAARRKRVWTVGDFAKYCGVTRWIARRMIAEFNREAGGALVVDVGGSVGWTFLPAALRKLKPELFEPLDTVENRLDDLEEAQIRIQIEHRATMAATGQNTRDIAQIKARFRAA